MEIYLILKNQQDTGNICYMIPHSHRSIEKNNESAYCLEIYIQVNFFLTRVMAHNFLKSEGKGK